MARGALLLLAYLCAVIAPAMAQQYRSQELRIPFAAAGPRGLQALLVRPDDGRRYPLALMSHGAPRGGADERRNTTPGRLYRQAVEFARRGYAVLIVIRRGYGESDGDYVEDSGPCDRRDYVHSGNTSAEDLRVAVAAMRERNDVTTEGMIAIGVSAGGFASIAFAALQPRGIAAVISFAGGRGSRADNDVCDQGRLVEAFGIFGKTARAPMLWVYSDNDLFFWPDLAKRFYAAFQASGGQAKFIAAPAFGSDGHGLFSMRGAPIWTPMVDAFLTEQNLGLRTPLPPPQASGLLTPDLNDRGLGAFRDYLLAGEHKAFAISKNRRFGWSFGKRSEREARVAALDFCQQTGDTCTIYAVDDELESEPLNAR